MIVIASSNPHKLDELRRIWAGAGLDLELKSLADFPGYVEPVENGRTFEANALIKARAAAEFTGLPAVADDSGIEVELLNWMPGVRSARWAGVGASPAASLQLLIDQLADTEYEDRVARFTCAMALVTPDGEERVVTGVMPGHLVLEPQGSNGFGYDPIFVTDGQQVTNGILTDAQKDALSHRGKAARAMAEYLRKL
ncbi:MAG: RdgB/HAM1 family non-canonical purine NTP pyrophosphatase [Propionibacteriaceae bacterium]|jgi:XTP/dITP diphosphohydrolase|nr:RdgB/HAM1 family non-canonical purine NTP pyrophosphatase [Propionibacteriaceae bacterium]